MGRSSRAGRVSRCQIKYGKQAKYRHRSRVGSAMAPSVLSGEQKKRKAQLKAPQHTPRHTRATHTSRGAAKLHSRPQAEAFRAITAQRKLNQSKPRQRKVKEKKRSVRHIPLPSTTHITQLQHESEGEYPQRTVTPITEAPLKYCNNNKPPAMIGDSKETKREKRKAWCEAHYKPHAHYHHPCFITATRLLIRTSLIGCIYSNIGKCRCCCHWELHYPPW
ncbi:unnamed protein product [Trypanosoma congolense IL3000]|uniref:WGS project CAEQ00000000 data, annotated contig 1730 n=1 Tax=Trypanosoma congolense (strain IL3000) TaxID=1068625 RepID=F9W8D3_TRYCI|nr:unnamed protein product [Trypanosoma congolense IL3000]